MSRAAATCRAARLLPALLAGVFALSPIVLASAAAEAASRNQVKQMVVEEALATRVPPSLALAVAKVESDFHPRALSPKGARGVMQIMPRTAMDEYGVAADELWRLRLNIQLGIDFLERLIERYRGRWDLALSHYNAGAVTGRPPAARVLPAARNYVDAVLRWERRYRDQAAVWAAASPLPRSLQASPGRGPGRVESRPSGRARHLDPGRPGPPRAALGPSARRRRRRPPRRLRRRPRGAPPAAPPDARRLHLEGDLEGWVNGARPRGSALPWLLAAAVVVACAAAPARATTAPERAQVRAMVIAEARDMGFPVSLALAVAHAESGFDSRALSRKGARGVMQIMPAVARAEYGLHAEALWDPRINIRLGIHFLRRLMVRYRGRTDLALSYYNGGSAVGDLPTARVLPATYDYVRTVRALTRRYQREMWSGGLRQWTQAKPQHTFSRLARAAN